MDDETKPPIDNGLPTEEERRASTDVASRIFGVHESQRQGKAERSKVFRLIPKAQSETRAPGQPAPKSDLIDQLLGLLKMANEGALTSLAWVGTKRDDQSGEDDEFGWGWSNTSELPRMRGYLRYLDDALGEATYATGGKRL